MLAPSLTGTQRICLNAVLAALIVRLLHLSDLSLWLDEGVTWWNATRESWTAAALAEHNHPPVWWLVTRVSLSIFSPDESGLRMPSVIAGVLSVILAGLLARRLVDPAQVPSRGGFVGLDRRATVFVVVLASIGAFWIAMSQEARMYSGLLAESIGLSLLYLRWLDRGRRSTLVAYALLASLSLYTHYYAVWPILGHALHAFLVSRRTRADADPVRLFPFFVTVALAGLSFVPWFLWFLKEPPGASTGTNETVGRYVHAIWRMAVGPAFVPLDRVRAEEGVVSVLRDQPVAITLSALLWLLPLVFGVRSLARDRGLRSFLACSIGLPSVAVVLIGIRYPLIEEKYLVFLAPLLLLLAVVGTLTAPRWGRPLLLAGLVVVHVAGFVAYHVHDHPVVIDVLAGGHEYGKEDWALVERAVEKVAQKGDVVLLHAPYLRFVWDFYAKGVATERVPIPGPDRPCDAVLSAAELSKAVPALAQAKYVVLVLSHECTADRDAYRRVVREALYAQPGAGWTEHAITNYPRQWGIRVATFERR